MCVEAELDFLKGDALAQGVGREGQRLDVPVDHPRLARFASASPIPAPPSLMAASARRAAWRAASRLVVARSIADCVTRPEARSVVGAGVIGFGGFEERTGGGCIGAGGGEAGAAGVDAVAASGPALELRSFSRSTCASIAFSSSEAAASAGAGGRRAGR